MELLGNIKNYEWGKLGDSSEVANLFKANKENFDIINNIPYAELWMGDHGSGPSVVKSSGQELGQVYKQRLPYLFKVLSVRKALSIQVHPNKEEATRLHKERPDLYKDPNHKPELAIALTPFMALCGFRPYGEIYQFCQQLPPLKKLLGGDTVVNGLSNGSTNDFKKCYETLMTADAADVSRVIDIILKDYNDVLIKYSIQETFSTLHSDYPGDVGALSLFFLNLLYLQPGESIFLGANEIHAYLSGDCIECMACSDNVIRAGLTPKFKDVKQLLASLNYTGLPGSSKLFQPKELDAHSKLFAPPVPDFAVVQISTSAPEYTLKLPQSPGILLVLSGSRTIRLQGHSDLVLKRGSIVFIPPENMDRIELLTLDNTNNDFNAYLATQNSFN
ncbi:mannose-6-phosphate isomerase [Calliphora vicina]|uniref:mannose-6-phosphate isomerase n=1 Tax=Calliphora vicina TaxID=7373 RepID=UPI00325B647E